MLAIKMFASGVASADAVAQVTIPMAGKIIAISFVLLTTKTASSVSDVLYQLSTQSTAQFSINDARNIVAEIGTASVGDNGLGTFSPGLPVNGFIPIPNLVVKQTDRIFLHRLSVANFTTALLNLNVWIS